MLTEFHFVCCKTITNIAWTRLKNDRQKAAKQLFELITVGKMNEEDMGLRLVK
jgi:hypothetical protein